MPIFPPVNSPYESLLAVIPRVFPHPNPNPSKTAFWKSVLVSIPSTDPPPYINGPHTNGPHADSVRTSGPHTDGSHTAGPHIYGPHRNPSISTTLLQGNNTSNDANPNSIDSTNPSTSSSRSPAHQNLLDHSTKNGTMALYSATSDPPNPRSESSMVPPDSNYQIETNSTIYQNQKNIDIRKIFQQKNSDFKDSGNCIWALKILEKSGPGNTAYRSPGGYQRPKDKAKHTKQDGRYRLQWAQSLEFLRAGGSFRILEEYWRARKEIQKLKKQVKLQKRLEAKTFNINEKRVADEVFQREEERLHEVDVEEDVNDSIQPYDPSVPLNMTVRRGTGYESSSGSNSSSWNNSTSSSKRRGTEVAELVLLNSSRRSANKDHTNEISMNRQDNNHSADTQNNHTESGYSNNGYNSYTNNSYTNNSDTGNSQGRDSSNQISNNADSINVDSLGVYKYK